MTFFSHLKVFFSEMVCFVTFDEKARIFKLERSNKFDPITFSEVVSIYNTELAKSVS